MHQTFYIDIDEEITSIIDRIRHAHAKEIIMVVPKRALLIQSIVNLRILKKEVDEAGLQLMMVTQDKLGKILIEKAGIFVQQKIDNITDEEINLQEDKSKEKIYETESKDIETGKNSGRLENIGSVSYFNEEDSRKSSLEKVKKEPAPLQNKNEKEELLNKELVTGIGSDIRKMHPEEKTTKIKRESPVVAQVRKDERPLRQDKKIENFFYQPNNSENRPNKIKKDNPEDYNLSRKIHKWFWIFGMISVVVFFGILAYLFIPKVDLTITVKTNAKSIDSEVTGDIKANSLDYDNGIIPAKVIEVQQEVTKKINATGSKSISNQKARGTVTIYNEFSSSPQPLVATTRLLTKDGKLFRLVAGVTVPGMTKDGEKSEKGSIEAKVVADQSGEEYNISSARFTIPGFQNSGNDKYSKFYAESTSAMTGGGDGAGQSNFITATDVTSARTEVLSELEDAIKRKIKETTGEEVILLDGAVKKDEAVYKLSNSEGDVADSFQITAGTKASAIVVNKKDLNDVVAHMIEKAGNGELSIDQDSVSLDFGKPNVDFDAGSIDIKFHGTGKISPNLNLLAIKNEILGKNEEALGEYLGTFEDIEKAEIDYWPSFINNRIPFRGKQVNITLDKQ